MADTVPGVENSGSFPVNSPFAFVARMNQTRGCGSVASWPGNHQTGFEDPEPFDSFDNFEAFNDRMNS
jgi:hypothetical protein